MSATARWRTPRWTASSASWWAASSACWPRAIRRSPRARWPSPSRTSRAGARAPMPAPSNFMTCPSRCNKGEILGIAGLVGAGRTETARAIFGADRFDSGRVLIDGRPVSIAGPRDAIAQGIGLVPEDRKQQALFLALAIRTNLSIAAHDRISSAGRLHQQQQGRRAGRGVPEAAQHPHGLAGPAGRQSLGRQPAEGGAGALAGAAPQGADRRRADARHRRGRQGRGAQPPVRDGGARASPSS